MKSSIFGSGYFLNGVAPIQMLVEMACVVALFIFIGHIAEKQMRIRVNKFFQATALLALAILYLRYRVSPPMPFSTFAIYVTTIGIGIFVWVSATARSWKDFCKPILFVLDGATLRTRIIRAIIVVALPCLVAGFTYSSIRWSYVKDEADGVLNGLRTVMPAPPRSITVHGKVYELQAAQNPFRVNEHGDYLKPPSDATQLVCANEFSAPRMLDLCPGR